MAIQREAEPGPGAAARIRAGGIPTAQVGPDALFLLHLVLLVHAGSPGAAGKFQQAGVYSGAEPSCLVEPIIIGPGPSPPKPCIQPEPERACTHPDAHPASRACQFEVSYIYCKLQLYPRAGVDRVGCWGG